MGNQPHLPHPSLSVEAVWRHDSIIVK